MNGWEVDFEGQKIAEWTYRALIVGFTVIGLAVGYEQQDFKYTFYAWAAGVALSCLLILPPWPCLRSHPIKFLPPLTHEDDTAPAAAADAPVVASRRAAGRADGKGKKRQ